MRKKAEIFEAPADRHETDPARKGRVPERAVGTKKACVSIFGYAHLRGVRARARNRAASEPDVRMTGAFILRRESPNQGRFPPPPPD